MKILFILPYIPVPADFGGALRVYYLLKEASRHNEVSVFAFGNERGAKKLRQEFGHKLKCIYILPSPLYRKYKRLNQLFSVFTSHSFFYLSAHSRKAQEMIGSILSKNDFDIIQTEFSHMASYNLSSNAVKILDEHNVEFDNFRRMAEKAHTPLRRFHYNLEYRKFIKEEIAACEKNDFVFATSKRDAELLATVVPDKTKFVVPNGVDTLYFKPSGEPVEPLSLVFTGAMSYVPNYDGILHFLRTAFPIIQKTYSEVKVYIVGSQPPRELLNQKSENIIVTGYVNDVRPYVWRSSVYIVPLRMGSGTRLKVLEAMAMKKPIVASSIGCEGIDVVDNESVLIADEPELFAQAVIQLFRNKKLQEKLVKNGYELVKTKYEWSVIGEQLDSIYKSLIKA